MVMPQTFLHQCPSIFTLPLFTSSSTSLNFSPFSTSRTVLNFQVFACYVASRSASPMSVVNGNADLRVPDRSEIRFGLPSKGRMASDTLDLLKAISMAFLGRVGSILKQSVSKQIGLPIGSHISSSNPSAYQALRCMSSSKLFIRGLPYAVDDSTLRDTFSQYGEVLEGAGLLDFATETKCVASFAQTATVRELEGSVTKAQGFRFAIFEPRPWGGYVGMPPDIVARCAAHDRMRLYLGTPFGSYWYLGERLARQADHALFVVPADPPKVLFVQTPSFYDRIPFYETCRDELLQPTLDYAFFGFSRLVCGPIEAFDPDLADQPTEFPTSVEYEFGGGRHTLELGMSSSLVTDHGMSSWADKVKKVAALAHKLLWRTANRWRDLAARQTIELCTSRADIA